MIQPRSGPIVKSKDGKPIVLSEHDVHLSETQAVKEQVKKYLKAVRWMIVPIIVAQAMQFGSFMYEEALQATGFAASQMIQSQDQAYAYDAVRTFEALMKRAQWYHKHFGQYAFWTAAPFYDYFYIAAPTQLAGMFNQGKKLQLWDEQEDRFRQEYNGNTGEFKTVDTYRMSPIKKLEAKGFDPEYDHDKRCLGCRRDKENGRAKMAQEGERIDKDERRDSSRDDSQDVNRTIRRGSVSLSRTE